MILGNIELLKYGKCYLNTFEELKQAIDEYIYFHNHERLKKTKQPWPDGISGASCLVFIIFTVYLTGSDSVYIFYYIFYILVILFSFKYIDSCFLKWIIIDSNFSMSVNWSLFIFFKLLNALAYSPDWKKVIANR